MRRLGPAVDGGDPEARRPRRRPWRTRRTRPSSGPRRRRRCRAARTRSRSARAAPVLRHQLAVGERRLRVLVEHLHVRVGRRAVEVEVVLLDVLAVVPLAVGEAEQPLLEDRILAVPERERRSRGASGRRRSRRGRPRRSGRRASGTDRGVTSFQASTPRVKFSRTVPHCRSPGRAPISSRGARPAPPRPVALVQRLRRGHSSESNVGARRSRASCTVRSRNCRRRAAAARRALRLEESGRRWGCW